MADESLKTVLYAASVAPLAEEKRYQAAYDAASPERKARADRYRREEDRRLSLGAELLLRHALRQEGIKELPPILRDAGGKPRFADCPWRFSLSHSGELALCALSPCEVGCDAEQITQADLAVAGRYFRREEYEDLLSRSPAEQNRLFFRYWTLKESFLKATGRGLSLPLDSFRVLPDSPSRVTEIADGENYRFAEFDTVAGYQIAVCTAGDGGAVSLHEVDLTEILL